MATKELVKVEVLELTRYGYKDQAGYVSYSKGMNETDKALVVPGAKFEAEYYVADSGTRYLNKIVAEAPHVSRPKPVVVKVEKKETPVKEAIVTPPNSVTSQVDYNAKADAKDKRISRQGVIQAAVQACAHFATDDVLFAMAEKLANQMLDFVNEVK